METQTLTIPMDKLLKYQEQIYKRREYQNQSSKKYYNDNFKITDNLTDDESEYQNQSSKKYYNDNFKITDNLTDDEKERRIEKRNAYNARRRQLYANKKRLARIQEIINNISG